MKRLYRRWLRRHATLGLLAFCVIAGASDAHAQAWFDGFQSAQTVVTSSLTNPRQAAVDSSGTIYIADAGNNRIVKESPSQSGYTESTIPTSTLNGPQGVAVDASGDVYIADTSNARVLKETWTGTAYTESVAIAATPYSYPTRIVVDSSGNIYLADAGELVKETLSGGSYIANTIPLGSAGTGSVEAIALDASGDIYIATAFQSSLQTVLKATPSGGTYNLSFVTTMPLASYPITAFGIAVDGSGNVYLSDTAENRVIEVEPASLGNYNQFTLDEDLKSPEGIALDSNGNIYVADSGNSRLVKDAVMTGNFGNVAVGSSVEFTAIFHYRPVTAGYMGTPQVLTSGTSNLDFVDAGTGTCTTNGPSYTYIQGQTCTLDVKFAPRFAGMRYGAVEMKDSAGVMTTGYMFGTGSGPQVSFRPGSQNTISLANVSNPYAIAFDSAGNLYIAKAVSAGSPSNAVVKETWNGSGYTQTVVATGFVYPVGVAIDGAGNVYVADQDASAIYKEIWTGSSYTQTTVDSSIGSVEAVAVDARGNVYAASLNSGILKEVLWQQAYSRTYVDNTILGPFGVAVDAEGNVYVADVSTSSLFKETPTTSGYTRSTITSLNDGHQVAIDGDGNIYVADFGDVLKETNSGGTYTQTTIATGLNGALGVAVDNLGNVYFSGDAVNSIWEMDYSDPPSLSFTATSYGLTSTDSPKTITVENSGNTALYFPIPASGNNPSISSSFALNSGGASSACPDVSASSANPGTLNAGSSCQLSVSFRPAATGAISGSLVLTDAASPTSPSPSTQTIPLSGTGLLAIPLITLSPSSTSITVLQSAMVTITLQNQAGGTEPTGTVTLFGGSYQSPSATLTNGSATITIAAGSLPVGTDTLTASYSGDSGFSTATATTSITVTTAEPTITLTPSSTSITTAQSMSVDIVVQTPGSGPTPSGTVTLTSGSYTVPPAPLTSGSATITVPAGSLPVGTDTLTASYSGDTNYSAGSATTVVTVTTAVPPGFAITGTQVTTTAGATTGNTSTITIAPAGGFSGSVALTAAVTSSPSGAMDLPTLSFGSTSSVSITGSASGTATLTVSTVARSQGTCVAASRKSDGEVPWGPAGGLALAAVGLFGIPGRRRKSWQTFLGMFLFLAVLSCGVLACGGGNSSQECNIPAQNGTSPGTYVVTVTGTSGATTATGTLTVVVQ